MNPAHKIHERMIGDMSQDQKLHHQQMLEPLRVSISPTDIADRIAYRRQAGTALIGVPPDLRSDEWWGSWPLFCPDGTVSYADSPMADTLPDGRPVRGYGFVTECPSGRRVLLLACSTPLSDGTCRRWGGVNAYI
jgi:hypothetical protein